MARSGGRGVHRDPRPGEIFQVCFHSFDGPVSAIAVEGIPGGPLAALAHLDRDADPTGFDAAVLKIIQEHAPSLRERIDTATFGLTRPRDLLQGQITPVVRRVWAEVNGTYAIALGDAWITHDPIAAQGANLGSRCAFLLGELITTSLSYDQQFCLEVERKMGELALAPTALSLAMLEPPGPELNHLLARAATDPAVADRFADGFAHPNALIASLNPAAA
jgi:2-polyprenyl-6-methoxyphenol hydroxylase-like FAD-dependent oxidoreductase